eukprot:TRINITY_DN13138_c0_g1_i1.p1 TRINITY_DN13138_c0_g1~~TRINITY_DN13138_c0_g1_i1.p1  ORF type:complete len:397 (-),score=34.77 TRINITY_DN13138_c0_g1_i1:342-1532(-)
MIYFPHSLLVVVGFALALGCSGTPTPVLRSILGPHEGFVLAAAFCKYATIAVANTSHQPTPHAHTREGLMAVATGGQDGAVRLWDPSTGQELYPQLRGHTDHVAALVTHPSDPSLLLSTSWDKTFRLWNSTTATSLCSPVVGHSAPVVAAAWDRHQPQPATRFATASWDGTVRLWKAFHHPHGVGVVVTPLATLHHQAAVYTVAFGPHGTLLSGGVDGAVKVWDLTTGTQVNQLNCHGSVYSLAINPLDPIEVLTASQDKAVRLWDWETGKLIRIFHAGSPVQAVTFFPGPPAKFLTGAADGRITVWSKETGAELYHFVGESGVSSLGLDPRRPCEVVSSALEANVRVHSLPGIAGCNPPVATPPSKELSWTLSLALRLTELWNLGFAYHPLKRSA